MQPTTALSVGPVEEVGEEVPAPESIVPARPVKEEAPAWVSETPVPANHVEEAPYSRPGIGGALKKTLCQ